LFVIVRYHPIMMKRVVLPLAIVLFGPAFLAHSRFASASVPFAMHVVDDQTGVGLASLRVTTDNGIICYTRANGDVTWTESSLMRRAVHFEVTDGRNQFQTDGVTANVTPGGQITITVRHRR
jgi:hypothetical protein